MPIRSYNDATENDAPGWITLTSNTRIDWAMFLNLLALLYWNEGADFYDNTKDIHVQNDVLATKSGASTLNTLFYVGSAVAGINDSLASSHTIVAYLNNTGGDSEIIWVREFASGNVLNSTSPAMAWSGIPLYYDYAVDWTALTFTVNIYTDSDLTITHRAAIVISISSTTAMQYMYAQASLGAGGAGSSVAGWNKNFNQIMPVLPGAANAAYYRQLNENKHRGRN